MKRPAKILDLTAIISHNYSCSTNIPKFNFYRKKKKKKNIYVKTNIKHELVQPPLTSATTVSPNHCLLFPHSFNVVPVLSTLVWEKTSTIRKKCWG